MVLVLSLSCVSVCECKKNVSICKHCPTDAMEMLSPLLFWLNTCEMVMWLPSGIGGFPSGTQMQISVPTRMNCISCILNLFCNRFKLNEVFIWNSFEQLLSSTYSDRTSHMQISTTTTHCQPTKRTSWKGRSVVKARVMCTPADM